MKPVLAACFTLLCATALSGQTVNGRITGSVTDPAGAAVPGAAITVTNSATTLTWRATTNTHGDYVVVNLPPGTYSVAAEAKGFKRAVRSGFELVSDGRITADFGLQLGEVSSTVEVTAVAGETVNAVSGEVSRTIDATQVQDMALNGRNYVQLVSLIPGAALLNEDQLALTTSLSVTGQVVNGNRSNSTNFTVDGAFNLDSGSNGSQINNVGVDFIREVQIKTSNFSAEYGRQSGASVNVVTRSGGNEYHGGLFEFFRNDKMDARSFFAPYRPSLRFNNFGWNLGGPIFKGKLFFFGGQEWKRIRRYTDPARRTLPTRAERAGDFSGRSGNLYLPGTTTPVPGRNLSSLTTADGRAIAAVYSRMEALATVYNDSATSNNATYQTANPFNARQDMIRLDYRINDAHSVYGRYTHDNYDIKDAFGSMVTSQLPTTPSNRLRPATSWQLGHTWVLSPRLIHEAKGNAGYHGQRVFLLGDDWTRSKYGFQYKEIYEGGGRYPTGIPIVSVSGFSSFNGPTYYISTSTDISFSDSLTWIQGEHTVKAGFLATRNRKDANTRPALTGSVTFNTSGNSKTTGNAFGDALTGNFRTYSEAQYDATGMFRFSQFDAYITDQWKVNRRLNVEIGVRYQAMLPVYTVANNIANFDPRAYDPSRAVTVLPNGSLVVGSGLIYNGIVRASPGVPASEVGRVPDATSDRVLSVPATAPRGLHQAAHPFAPRVSFAWSPKANNKTAVRGGFGMFYDRIDLTAIVQGGLAMPPFAETVQYENGNLANPFSGVTTARGVNGTIRPIDPGLKFPYTMNYSLSVQHELPAGVFLEAAYVGNQSRHLMRQPDINQPPFSVLAANAAKPSAQRATTNALRQYAGFSQILMRLSDANSNYNAMQLYATKRKGWFTGTVSYTWSKALSDASSQTESSEEPLNRRFNYGPATYDRRHLFVTTINAKLPFYLKAKGLRGGALGGWEVSLIARAQSGQYYTVTSSTDIGTRRADYIGGSVALPSDERSPNRWFNTAVFTAPPATRGGNAGFGTVQGPGLYLWDFSFRKQFRVTERVKLRFQADMFNAFNKANLRGLSVSTSSRDFGSLTTAGPGRDVQLGLKINF